MSLKKVRTVKAEKNNAKFGNIFQHNRPFTKVNSCGHQGKCIKMSTQIS